MTGTAILLSTALLPTLAGIVSPGSAEPRAFATDMSSIKAIGVSQDGKLVALGDSEGHVEVWELR